MAPQRGNPMRPTILRCAVAGALLLAFSPFGGVAAIQAPAGVYRVDWNRAPFTQPYWLIQCPAGCPNGTLALVPDPAGNRIIGGPYSHGADLERDRNRLLQLGMPATTLAVEVFDESGRRVDGVALGDPAELRRLAATVAGPQTSGPRSGAASTLCRFTQGPQTGRTVDFAGRRGVSGIAVGSRCADADGSMGIAVSPSAPSR